LARRRFFVEAVHAGAAELHGEDARHLTRVLRAEPGQRYEISDTRCAYLAEIVEARGERVVFRVLEPIPTAALPASIILAASLIKFDRFEWLVEKATELGVARILPVAATRSEKGLMEASRKRAARWMRIAHEAGQQSRRLRPPEILPAVPFESCLALTADYRYFLDDSAAVPLLAVLPQHRPPGAAIALLAGPEGGWTDAERQAAIAALWTPVSLGPQILRAETATLAALAVVLNAWLVSESVQ
jgi:16S rRNA (uracil1498-N3)-methyltransferase